MAEGAFHEGVNLAAIWDLPVVFVCENNLYGASTRIDQVMRTEHVADRAAAYGIRGETVDGNDVLAVLRGGPRARPPTAAAGDGPVLLELLTYRRTGHSRRDACHYQPQDEREDWLRRDPIDASASVLIERGLTDAGRARRDPRPSIEAQFQAAVERRKRSRADARRPDDRRPRRAEGAERARAATDSRCDG